MNKFIEKHRFLREFFEELPKRLMELAYQGKIVKFSGEDILVNMVLLREYLLQPTCILNVDSLEDFLDSLHILGFTRGAYPEVDENLHLIYRFNNPKFVAEQPVPEDLYKHLSNTPKPVKVSTSGVRLLQKLMVKKTTMELRLSRLELVRMKLDFSLAKALESARSVAMPDIIEFNTESDQNDEIPGYYGNVTTEALKRANYTPTIKKSLENDSAETENMEGATISAEVEIQCEEPEKKKRKYTKKSRSEIKETEQAIMFLQQQEASVEPMEL